MHVTTGWVCLAIGRDGMVWYHHIPPTSIFLIYQLATRRSRGTLRGA